MYFSLPLDIDSELGIKMETPEMATYTTEAENRERDRVQTI
jgi:hypothetical protein